MEVGGTKWIFTKWVLCKKGLITIFIMLIIVLLNSLYFIGSYPESSGGDILLNNFAGYGLGYFNLVPFMFLVLLNNIPLYFLSSFLSDNSFKNSHVTIRLKSPRKWFVSIQLSYFTFILFYYFLVFILSIIIASICSFNSVNKFNYLEAYTILSDSLWINIFYIIILRILEAILIQLLFLLIYVNSRSITIGFYLAVAPYLLIFYNIWNYYPYGLSSLLRQNTYNSICFSFVFLLILCVLLFIYFILWGYKKINDIINYLN